MVMKRVKESITVALSWLCSLLLAGSVATIIGYLLFKGLATINLALIFGDTAPLEAIFLGRQVFNGLLPAMVGTLALVLLALTFAIPLGVAAGIYMAEYGKGRLKGWFSLFFDILASIPSIVVGLFGFSVAVFLHHNLSERIYPCLLIAALSLAFLVLPYIIRTTQVALESIPVTIRQTALAPGATKLQNISHVLLPHALSAMMSGIILAMGRCAEDTAVIMLTGVVASAGMPRSIFAGFEALPFYIYYISAQYSDSRELASGYGAAIILLIICMMLFGLAFYIKARFELTPRSRSGDKRRRSQRIMKVPDRRKTSLEIDFQAKQPKQDTLL